MIEGEKIINGNPRKKLIQKVARIKNSMAHGVNNHCIILKAINELL